MRVNLDRARALGTISYAVKQEGFSLYESDAATGIFYAYYSKIDPEGPGWFSRKWSSIRNAGWVKAIFGEPEEDRIKLSSPYTLAELSANLPQGRSEERRVGKECRSRWWPAHEKKKSGRRRAVA